MRPKRSCSNKDGLRPPAAKQMGKDGKWQLNVYDPDGTRVELMEFRPKERPCCSEFTAPYPAELKWKNTEARQKAGLQCGFIQRS